MSQKMEDFRRGTAEMLILHLLQSEDLYAYQIAGVLKEKSCGAYNINIASLYPVLYKMVKSGYITEYEKTVNVRRKRIYYHLEEKGREYYKQTLCGYVDITKGIYKILDIELI